MKKKIVIFTGAGISAESNIPTFRDRDGLWNKYDPEEVATGTAFKKNPEKVLDFLNVCKTQMASCSSNEAHEALVRLEEKFDVIVITQNIDFLHEEGGSTNVIHLHGNIFEKRSSKNRKIIEKLDGVIEFGDVCEDGSQWRHNVVLFEENLPTQALYDAEKAMENADMLVIVGTTLEVYPAAGLIAYYDQTKPIYIVDPGKVNLAIKEGRTFVVEKATIGVPYVVDLLLKESSMN